MTGNMWNSYHIIEDLDVCLNPYGKDAYGNYRIGDNKKKNKKKINTGHKYFLDIIGIWNIGEYTGVPGELAVAQIVNLLTDTYTVVPQYQVKILDGKHKDKILTVFENEAVEEIDPTPWLPLPKEYLPNDCQSNNTSDFQCDIDDLKTDISDLRTNINDLVNDSIGIKGDILAIKSTGEGDIMLDNDSSRTVKSSIIELENKFYDVEGLIDNKVNDINEHIALQEREIKKISKVSKLSLLNSIAMI